MPTTRPFAGPVAKLVLSLVLPLALGACATASLPSAPAEQLTLDRTRALGSVNAFRAEHGMPPLRMEAHLMAAAAAQSAAMAKRGKMDHEVAGKLPDRVRAAGYDWTTTAENIAASFRDHDSAMAAWVASPGHRKNLLNTQVTEIGFAAAKGADGKPYWTQIFGKPRAR